MALALAVAGYFAGLDLTEAAGIGVLAWLGLFGSNCLIALIRFRWFVKRCVREGFEDSIRMTRAA